MNLFQSFFLISLLLGSCRPKSTPVLPTTPPKQQTPIGTGVEVYRAKLTWNNANRNTIIKAEPFGHPVVRYDEIINLEKKHMLLSISKRPEDALGRAYVSKPDTGLAITVDKSVLYGTYHKSWISSFVDISPVFFITSNSPSIWIDWDSTLAGNRGQPDPRYNDILLNRLAKDGKLK